MKDKISKSNSMINKIYNMRAEELAQEKYKNNIRDKERFLDIVENVKNIELKQKLIEEYLKSDDEFGNECARLIKKYYTNGYADGVKLIMECMNYSFRN